ncbi:hypothetical protein, partial [Neisseria meningitidis]|uniref:hypothetical protein n=1 Tax=Neisseria meningitidis TaxID=487 RepID=UPI001C8F9310
MNLWFTSTDSSNFFPRIRNLSILASPSEVNHTGESRTKIPVAAGIFAVPCLMIKLKSCKMRPLQN